MDYRGLWFWYRKLSLVYTCVHTHLFLYIKYLNQKGWPDVKARLRTRYLFFQKSFSCCWKYHRRTEVSVLYHSLFNHFIHLIFYCLLWQQPLEGFSLTVKTKYFIKSSKQQWNSRGVSRSGNWCVWGGNPAALFFVMLELFPQWDQPEQLYPI